MMAKLLLSNPEDGDGVERRLHFVWLDLVYVAAGRSVLG
jgi:hypothetical protein